MGQGQGTSTEGWQKLIDGNDRELPIVTILIPGEPERTPLDVGYFYVQLYVTGGDPETVYDSGILYAPGMIRHLPDITITSLTKISLWVRWKVPGLDWVSFF